MQLSYLQNGGAEKLSGLECAEPSGLWVCLVLSIVLALQKVPVLGMAQWVNCLLCKLKTSVQILSSPVR